MLWKQNYIWKEPKNVSIRVSSRVPAHLIICLVNDVILIKYSATSYTHLLPTCSSTVHSWLNVSDLFGWQILPLIICQENTSDSHVKRLRRCKNNGHSIIWRDLCIWTAWHTESVSLTDKDVTWDVSLGRRRKTATLLWLTNKILLEFRE